MLITYSEEVESTMQTKIHVIVPAYNEEGNIDRLFEELKKANQLFDLHLIIVNDGSSDRTAEKIKEHQDELTTTVITHPTNLGVPQTFYDGLVAASRISEEQDVIILMEGDCTSDISLFESMVEKIKDGAGVVVASRMIPGGSFKNFPFVRTLGSKFINLVLNIFFHTKGITDYTIFYRAYSPKVLKQAIRAKGEQFITTKSFAANLEVLLNLKPYLDKTAEVPLVYDYGLKKGKSKMNIGKTLNEYRGLIFKRITGRL